MGYRTSIPLRHSRESGNPASFDIKTLGPRFRGDDGLWYGPGTLFTDETARMVYTFVSVLGKTGAPTKEN